MQITTFRRTAGVSALALAALAAPAAAQDTVPAGPGLTLAEAVGAAREQNPQMQAQRNDVRATRAAIRNARADFLPSATVGAGFGYTAPGVQRFGSEVFGERPEYWSSSWDLSLRYDLSGAKLLQPGIARAQHRAAESRIAGYEAALVSDVSQQYLTALQAAEQVAQAEREVARTAEHLRLAQAKLEVGSGTPLDVRRAQVDHGQAEVQLVQTRNTHATELLRLGRLMGTVLPEDTRLTSDFALFEPEWQAEALVAMAIENNPTLAAARASSAAAGTQVRAARSQYLPTLSFQVGLDGSVYSAGDIDPLVQQQLRQLSGSFDACTEQNVIREAAGLEPENCAAIDPQDPAVRASIRDAIAAENPSFPFGYQRQPLRASVNISLPLFDGLARERRVEEARVAAADARLEVEAEQQRLATEVRAGVLALRTAYRTAQLQRAVADNAAEELRMARERFRLGAATSIEVTDAQTRLAEAERAVIDAVYTYHKSLATLEALVGRQLR